MELDPSGSARRREMLGILGMVYRLVYSLYALIIMKTDMLIKPERNTDLVVCSQHPKLGVNTFEPYTGEDPIFECLDGRNRRHHGITIEGHPCTCGVWSMERASDGVMERLMLDPFVQIGKELEGQEEFQVSAFLHFCILNL